jgi:F0F1-type ATP synthase membrane subunit b/b'
MLTKREDYIKGSLNSAKAMETEREAHLKEIEAKLADAREKAKAIFEEFSKEGARIQKGIIETAYNEDTKIQREAKRNIEAEVEKTRQALRSEVENFSRMIVKKMVGV